MTDEDILKIFNTRIILTKIKCIRDNGVPDGVINYLEHRYPYYDNLVEVVNRIKFSIETRPVCEVCGAPVKYRKSNIFALGCCQEHANIINAKHVKETSLKKYGCENPAQSQQAREAVSKANKANAEHAKQIRKETNLSLYGVENCYQSPEKIQKIKAVKLERYGNENYVNVKKCKQTKLDKYGTENYVNVEKCKQTKLDKYGDENYNNMDKHRETCLEKYGFLYASSSPDVKNKVKETSLERYGVECTLQNPIIQEQIKEANIQKYGYAYVLSSPDIQNKSKATCLTRYNVEYHTSSQEYKDYMKVKMKSDEVQEKRMNTFRKNNSWCLSKQEECVHEMLKSIFLDVLHGYHSNEYPFNCDFYIPSLKLYIEYNGSHYHHKHPFNEYNEDDILELKLLKEKAQHSKRHKEGKKSQYDIMVDTWTIRDPLKRQTAQQNNLNYIEFWTIKEVEDWLKSEAYNIYIK